MRGYPRLGRCIIVPLAKEFARLRSSQLNPDMYVFRRIRSASFELLLSSSNHPRATFWESRCNLCWRTLRFPLYISFFQVSSRDEADGRAVMKHLGSHSPLSPLASLMREADTLC